MMDFDVCHFYFYLCDWGVRVSLSVLRLHMALCQLLKVDK